VPFGGLPHAIMMVMILLMFVGGSPGSCAGGIKTTTFSGMIVVWKDWLFGASRKRFFKRKISGDTIRKIKAVIGLAIIWILLSFAALLYTESLILATDPSAFQDLLFEVVSAMGTVGLSAGVTPHLSSIGRIVIIMDMFIGRVGPLAVVTALLNAGTSRNIIGYPEERIMIG
ncbi:MAG: TrkH family potassium uptake protein, partial [Acidobacteria bacterium]|nr:TrkH family potassium uptake protein [Acidobacteriota bacterium]